MDDSYWIVDDAIIFKSHFDKYLNNYTDIMLNYKVLIFSNYTNTNITLKHNNKFTNINQTSFVKSSFNKPLGNSLLNLVDLKKLTFGFHFNHPLGNSLSYMVNLYVLTFSSDFNQLLGDSLSELYNLQKIIFGWDFNQPLDDSLSNLVNLRELTFGRKFNQPVNNSLSGLTNLRELTLGHYFNQSIDIPGWIKKLYLNCNYQQIIDYLPLSIEELVFGPEFNLELNDLPNSIKKIKILNSSYDKKLNNLPTGIKYLEISKYYKKKLTLNIKI